MISVKHRVIFTHIPKCAGQSVESIFLNELGLTWENRSSLLLRPSRFKEQGPERLAHLYACEYVGLGYISKKQFDSFFKFAIIRDPIDRILSEMNYRNIARRSRFGVRGVRSVEEYIVKTLRLNSFKNLRRHISPQINYLCDPEDENKLLVDKLIRFDDINSEFLSISNDIFGKAIELPTVNKSKTKIWTKNLLSSEDERFLNDFYKKDIEYYYPKEHQQIGQITGSAT